MIKTSVRKSKNFVGGAIFWPRFANSLHTMSSVSELLLTYRSTTSRSWPNVLRYLLVFDRVKNRDAVAAFHHEGIRFSVTPMEHPDDPRGPPVNIAFLEILCEFINKLMKRDKKYTYV